MHSAVLACLTASALTAAACGTPEPVSPTPDAGPTLAARDGGTTDAGASPNDGPCATRAFEPLQAHAIRYATEVHPLLVSRCASCHDLDSRRLFRLPTEPVAAFTELWTQGLFARDDRDAIYGRVTARGPDRMPQDGGLGPTELDAIERFTCGLARYALGERPDGGVLADAGTVDAGAPPADGGVTDAGVVDGGAVDAGGADAGIVDGGSPLELYTPARCPPGAPATVEAHAERFAQQVMPLLTRARREGGCVSCHTMDSGRTLRIDDDGVATFHRINGASLLDLTNGGSMLHRLARRDEAAMPPGGPSWSEAEVGALYSLMCDMRRGPPPPPADEVFPPELLQPWTGGASTTYDNTTLTYRQLRGRIVTQFGDTWVRDGVDRFAANVARFGGVDFSRAFVPQRQVTADYILGLESLAQDVCVKAAQEGTGPFQGLDLRAPVLDEPPSATWQHQLENTTRTGETPLADAQGWTVTAAATGRGGSTNPANQELDPRYLGLFSNSTASGPYVAPITGTYRVTVRARGTELPPDLPRLVLYVNGVSRATFNIPADAEPSTAAREWTLSTVDLPLSGGEQQLGVGFNNDAYVPCTPPPEAGLCGDRNLLLDWIRVEGPLPGTTIGAPGGVRAGKDRIATLLSRILLRPAREAPGDDELAPLHALLLAQESIDGDRVRAWAGVCEGLLQHPDFLFTRRPSAEAPTNLEPARALFVRTALDLLDRPPTAAELAVFDAGTPRATFIDEWLQSAEFRAAFFHKVQLLLESDGTDEANEPARLWLHLAMRDAPMRELLTAGYTTRATRADLTDLEAAPRFAEYGATGLLVMRGYLKNKPGLPHYNYAARVLSDFLGHVFEVPPDIVDTRAGATPVSTTQPGTVCFSCHQLLTPLAHQRLGWADDGLPRSTQNGAPIDDSDRNMVPSYPYRGRGMAAFANKAVRKERFLRRMANSQVEMLLGRPMRHDTDERGLYAALWSVMNGGEGSFRAVLRAVLLSPEYAGTVATGVQP